MSTQQQVLRERALQHLMRHNVVVPTRNENRKKHQRRNTFSEELRRHPGDIRSRVLDAIKAISAKDTGCTVATQSELDRIGQLGQRQGRTVVVRVL